MRFYRHKQLFASVEFLKLHLNIVQSIKNIKNATADLSRNIPGIKSVAREYLSRNY